MTVKPSIYGASRCNNPAFRRCLYSIFNPNGKYHKYLALLFMCGLHFGGYFCYYNPSALQDNIIKDMNITTTQFSLLFALYSWPATVVCVLGGVLIDRYFGVRYGAIIFGTIVLIGHLIFSIGALLNAFWIMALGRFVFGLGAEPLTIAQTAYASKWFGNAEISMIFGIQESCSDSGSIINYWVMSPIYDWVSNFFTGYTRLGITLLIASTTCIFSVTCALILGVIHKRAKEVVAHVEDDTSKITFKDIRMFPPSFWLAVFIEVNFMGIYPFFALSKVFFMTEFATTADEANHLCSLMYFIPFFGGPIMGFILDKVGKNIFWLMLALTLTISSHCMLAFFPWNPCYAVVLMSVAKCIFGSSFYPMVVFLIPGHHLSTAYGLCWSLQNLSMGTTTMLSGIIVDQAGYKWLEIFYLNGTMLSLVASVVLLMVDISYDGILNLTPSQRNARATYSVQVDEL